MDNTKIENIKTEVAKIETAKIETAKVENEHGDIFITEDNTFDVTVKYYKENNNVFVEGVDDAFDITKKSKQFTVTIKYPSQSDVSIIYKQSSALKSGALEDIDIRDILGLEFSRFLCLMRKWTLSDKLDLSTIMKLNPKIVKSIVMQVRVILGMDGII
jgi:hypothetical protein